MHLECCSRTVGLGWNCLPGCACTHSTSGRLKLCLETNGVDLRDGVKAGCAGSLQAARGLWCRDGCVCARVTKQRGGLTLFLSAGAPLPCSSPSRVISLLLFPSYSYPAQEMEDFLPLPRSKRALKFLPRLTPGPRLCMCGLLDCAARS